MARNGRVKINLRGVNDLLRSAQPLVDKIGEGIAADADGNYEYVTSKHRWTGRGFVQTGDAATAESDAKTNELIKAVGRAIR